MGGEQKYASTTKNIARVQNCHDIRILTLFGQEGHGGQNYQGGKRLLLRVVRVIRMVRMVRMIRVIRIVRVVVVRVMQ